MPITVQGKNPNKEEPPDLTNSGVGGVQMADVSVDIETGIVRVNKMVAVQDCGLVINLKTAESQCKGALIMGISYSLYEEKVLDPVTGRMLNADMEHYRLAGYGDIPDLVVHMMTGKGYDERGVIGLGEPPVISPGAAISNAVANAIGVRVPFLPLTPDRVLAALNEKSSRERRSLMHSFEYTSPTSKEQAVQLLGSDWSQASVFAGGTDLLALMKDDIETPKRVVNIKSVAGLDTISFAPRAGMKIGALAHLSQLTDNVEVQRNYPMLAWAADEAASPQIRNMATIGGNLCQRPRCWYYRSGMGLLALDAQGKSMLVAGDNRHAAILGNDGPALFVSPSTIAPALIAYGATVRIFGPGGPREVALEKFYLIPKSANQREHDLKPNEIITDILLPAPADLKAAQYEVRQKYRSTGRFDGICALKMNGRHRSNSARIVLGAVAPVPWVSHEAAQAITGKPINEATAAVAGKAAVAGAKPLSRNAYKIQLTQVAVKRALLQAAKGGQA